MFFLEYSVNNTTTYEIKEYRDKALEMYINWCEDALEETYDGFRDTNNEVILIEIDDDNIRDIIIGEEDKLDIFVLKRFYTDENYNWIEEEEEE